MYLKRAIIPNLPQSTSKFCFSRLSVLILPPVISSHFHPHPYLSFSSSAPVCQSPSNSILFAYRYLSSYQSTQLYHHTHEVLSKLWGFIRNVYPAVAPSVLTHSCWDFASLLGGQLCTPNFWFSALFQKSTLEVKITFAHQSSCVFLLLSSIRSLRGYLKYKWLRYVPQSVAMKQQASSLSYTVS